MPIKQYLSVATDCKPRAKDLFRLVSDNDTTRYGSGSSRMAHDTAAVGEIFSYCSGIDCAISWQNQEVPITALDSGLDCPQFGNRQN